MVHRTLQAALRRRELDDRDHYGNKRLDLAGALMAYLFRSLFKQFTKDVGRFPISPSLLSFATFPSSSSSFSSSSSSSSPPGDPFSDRRHFQLKNKLQRAVNRGKDFNLEAEIATNILTNGLRYSLATGNWGDQKKAHQSRAGVSQVILTDADGLSSAGKARPGGT